MRPVTDSKSHLFHIRWTLIRVVVALFLLISAAVILFTLGYSSYTDGILYAERLGQMQEVTGQLFHGLEDVVENQWYNATVQTNRVVAEQPATTGALLSFLRTQADLSKFESVGSDLVAVDNRGRFYTQNGVQGLLPSMDYLADSPERISFVASAMTKERTQMFFLNRLDEPIPMRDGERTVSLIYYGIARDMTELNQYFDCDAYQGRNSIYVLDEQGTKLFSGENRCISLDGFNAYTVLRTMKYLHNSTFDGTLDTLAQNGAAYSNAILDGEECYYALYQMDNAAWVLLFLVPSRYVAVNTVDLVHSTTELVMVFAVFMILLCAGCIYWILRRQQKRALRVVEDANAMLEANNKELERAQVVTKEALQAAETASKAKTDFLSSMSHDIRTPMNAILGLTTLMEGEPGLSDRMHDYLHKLEGSGRHLLELINNVLDMNRIESGQTTLSIVSINLAEQVAQVENLIRPQASEREQTLTIVTTHLNHEYVMADSTRLQQVLVNLLSNAVKYTPKGGHILFELVELPRSEHYAKFQFVVQDDGIGMDKTFLQHIFDPFTRAEDSVTNQVQGTGLGMAITKSIVDLMGGVIHVESTPGKGSRFEVTLELPIDTEADQNVQHLSVLLVQCDDSNFKRIEDAVEGRPIQMHRAMRMEDAFTLLQKANYDVVLMRLCTPERDLETIRELAGDSTILLCIAGPQNPDPRPVNGADGCLPYPFFLSNLEAEVRRVQEARISSETETVEDESPLVGMKFLCAEDNEINAEILQMLLESKGASCTICRNGQEIVDTFASVQPGEYDMILMDVQMPVMDGLEATRRIRSGANPLGRHIPILAMTANAFLEDMQKSREAGMDEHLSKPVDIHVLEQTVRRFRATPPPRKIRSGKTRFN